MSGRRTNLALGVLLAAALVSGTVAFGLGTPPAATAVVVIHGVVGIGVLVLSPWKSMVVRRGLRRPRRGRWASIALAVLTTIAVATGIAHSLGVRSLGIDLTAMQVHVGAALALGPLAVWHAIARPTRVRRTDWSRRAALRGGTVLAVAGAGWLAVEGVTRTVGLRGAERRFTGSHEVGSGDPAAMPVTQWLDDPVPRIDAATWRLTTRAPGRTSVLTLADLDTYDDEAVATLDCTGGWYATQTWGGVLLGRLVDVGTAGSVIVRSATGYSRRLPPRDAARALVAVRVGGQPLSAGHGFPARLVMPGRRGFWWVKWIDEVAVDDRPWWWQPPFPLT